MKKKFLGIVAAVAVVAIAGVNYLQMNQSVELSDLALANVEALAQGELLPDVDITCGATEGRCWKKDWVSASGLQWSCSWTGYQQDYCLDCPFI